jgi:Mannosyltransferase (PIG-V)
MAVRRLALGGEPFPGVFAVLLDGWVGWDSHWYLQIARDGYFFRPGEQSSVAYFPLYPLAMRGLMALGLAPFVAGALVSLVSGVGAVLLFTRWAQTQAAPAEARDGGLFLALYPFAFFLYGVVYGDSLFLLLVVASFLLLERGHLFLAVLVAALATAARPVAPALVVGLLARRLEWKRERGERWSAVDLLPVFAATGFLLYVLYQARTFGNPFAFVETQGSPGWDQAPGPRTWFKVVWFERMFPPQSAGIAVRHLAHAGFTLAALALVVPTVKRLGWGYGLYSLAVVGLPAMSSKDFMGMGRYLLAAFPLFLTLALLVRERPRLRVPLLAASGLLLVFLAGVFGADVYVS